MNVMLLNGSPRRAGATAMMLAALAAGLRKSGAGVEIVDLRRLDLDDCVGCFDCWLRTPGNCVFRDAMSDLLPRFGAADLLVFGTPLYHFGMTALLKTFIDRTLPLAEPWLIRRADGLTGHPSRLSQARPARALLVSPCGFPERGHFEALVATFRLMAHRSGWEWVGEILRPASGLLIEGADPDRQTYLDLLSAAGEALARGGGLPEALADNPGDGEDYRALVNRHFAAELQRRGLPAAPLGAVL